MRKTAKIVLRFLDLLALLVVPPLESGVDETLDALDGIIFSGGADLVRDVMVGGAWIVREGRHAQEHSAASAYKRVVAELLA